jgi:type IX secretion system PorP/SprF family membrane protein
MKRKLILIAIISCISSQAYSQIDKQFSMFAQTKVQINPAAAGFFKAKYKFFTNYRQQWWAILNEPSTTYSASFDTRIYEDQRSGRFMGAGLVFANDITGDLKYNQLNISVPINYSIRLDDYNTLSGGISPGYFQRSINNNNPTWDNQWDNRDGFDQTIPSGEQVFNNRFLVGNFDLGAGLYWEFNYDDYTYMSLGISTNHITKPKVNYLPLDERMNRSMNIHYFGNFGREDFPLTFRPSVMWSVQQPNQSLVFGTTIDILLRGESKMTGYYNRTSLEIGGHFRLEDAVIGSIALHTGGFSMGFSYDMIVSSLSTAIGNYGATEFFVFYRMGKPQGRGKLELVEE